MYLQITSVTNGTDKNGVIFKKVGFSPLTFLPTGKQLVQTGKERFRVVFPDAEREVNGVKTLIKGDLLYHSAKVGEAIEGQISSFETATPYKIGDNILNTVTVVAFGNESPAVLAANQAGVAVRDGDEVIAPTKVKKAVAPADL